MAFKFEDVTVTGWILLAVLVVCALGLLFIARSKQKNIEGWAARRRKLNGKD